MDPTPTTKLKLKVLESRDPTQPSLVLQVTEMVDTYMLWIGAADSNNNIGNGETTVLKGNLCTDWACAMPPRVPGGPPAGTSLFRTSTSDIALAMAQRLAKRFQKQIFLSVDIPSGFSSFGGGARLALEAEKGIVATLKEIESAETAH